ncbi:hypothetical protein Pcinc_014927 [Petrolisthes cinctipes]|uniref:VWFA domain-containing protein n=1 Tax=Petrolisthes cinctipes TaxID=88211 RepID=A0AAE1FVG7_PETCI|nr:hypothetical protein Pcinc_014927 [Petrolisthes cinctipes]
MKADMGGTEILNPLKSIYSNPPKPEYSRQILLISDGSVFNVSQVTELVARNSYDTRVFSVGIGHGASTSLIHGVARAGRGRYEMVVDQDKLQHKVMGLVRSMLQDSVQGVSVTCRVEPATNVSLVPKAPPVIFAGQHLILYARVTPDTKVCEITVKGSTESGGEVKASVDEDNIVLVHDEEMSLHRLAARAQINQWKLHGDDDVGDDMVALSVASSVVSPRTAFIGVDQESRHIQPYLEMEEMCDMEQQDSSYLLSRPRGYLSVSVGGRSSSGSRGSPTLKGVGRLAFGTSAGPLTGTSPQSRRNRFALEESSAMVPMQCEMQCPMPTLFYEKKVTTGDVKELRKCKRSLKSSYVVKNLASVDVDGMDGGGSSGVLKIVELQRFDGSWSLDDAATISGVPLDKLKAANTAKSESVFGTVVSESVFGTAVVLAVLEKHYNDDLDQWILLATKAGQYITNAGHDKHTLLTLAHSLINDAHSNPHTH